MAVFSTNLIIYAHTDFEQTFLLEDNQSNSAKDLTGFTATARMKRQFAGGQLYACLLYTSPSPRDATLSRMPSSA